VQEENFATSLPLYRGGQFCWRKPEDPKKTTDLLLVADKHHIMLYTSPWVGVKPTTSVVIDTDCIGNCKSNKHAITATTPLSETVKYWGNMTTCFRKLTTRSIPRKKPTEFDEYNKFSTYLPNMRNLGPF
jgi:hypothetical protein